MSKSKILSKLPSVDELLNNEGITELLKTVPRRVIIKETRDSIEVCRRNILAMDEGTLKDFSLNINKMVYDIILNSKRFINMNLKKVVNATGTVLHTNLGRALLSDEVKEKLWDIASGYSTLEIDVSTGKRGSRYNNVTEIIKFITGAEDVLVVNNNAAAVILVLSTMAKNKEVIVSRGELIEIGGSFRIPDVMEESGAKLIDIGTTNKTHLVDYENAISEDTAAFLKVHTSNYKVLGFTESVDVKELVKLGKKTNIPVIEDLGSGVLVDLQKYGLIHEPTVQESVSAGADIVTFSGDKLLGGPQAGIIIGKKSYIDAMKKNPLTRAFRIDKLTLAALEATFKIYLDEEKAIKDIPTLKMLTESIESITNRAETLKDMIISSNLDLEINICEDYSEVGGGSLPLQELPTTTIRLKPRNYSTSMLENRLRKYKTPIFTRVQEDKIIIDPRTIKEDEYEIIIEALMEIMQ